MIWINNIWFYFLDEDDIPIGYLDEYSGFVYEENNNGLITIPKFFKRIELLKEYILSTHDNRLIREINNVSDKNLREYFHCKYSPYFDLKNYPHSNWLIYSKKRLVDYAVEWCWNNGIKCTAKKCDDYSGFVYLEAYYNE